jgi:hypothetical protein
MVMRKGEKNSHSKTAELLIDNGADIYALNKK